MVTKRKTTRRKVANKATKEVVVQVGRMHSPVQTIKVQTNWTIGMAFERAGIDTKGNDQLVNLNMDEFAFTDTISPGETYLLTKNYSNGL
jgi:hypothetical protein